MWGRSGGLQHPIGMVHPIGLEGSRDIKEIGVGQRSIRGRIANREVEF